MWEKMVCSECDSTEENTNVDNNNLTSTISAPVIQNKRKNYKKYIIIIILLFVTLWSGYAYLQTVWKISLNSAMEKIWWKDSIWLNENKIVNYLFGIDWNFEYKNVNWNSWSGVINIVDGKIYSANKWLNQKISVWELNSNTYLNNENQNISIKNLDIVSDNEKVYFFMEKWYDQLISLFWDLSSTWTITDIKNSFDWKKSIMIDNSKQLLETYDASKGVAMLLGKGLVAIMPYENAAELKERCIGIAGAEEEKIEQGFQIARDYVSEVTAKGHHDIRVYQGKKWLKDPDGLQEVLSQQDKQQETELRYD